jgi:HEAT repeat protein
LGGASTGPSDAEVRPVCKSLAKMIRDRDGGFCRDHAPAISLDGNPRDRQADCAKAYAFLTEGTDACRVRPDSPLGHYFERGFCTSMALVSSALRAGDRTLCGSDPRCLAVLSDPATCGSEGIKVAEERYTAKYCDFFSQTIGTAGDRAATRPERSVKKLIAALESPRAAERLEAAAALQALGGEARAAIPALVSRFADPDQGVALEAEITLASMGRASVPALVKILRGSETDRRSRAVSTLLRMQPSEARDAVPALIEQFRLQDYPGVDGRPEAEEALIRIGTPAIPELSKALSKDPITCVHAAEALGGIGPLASKATPALIQALASPEAWPDATNAITGCYLYEGIRTPAVPYLIEALKDKNEQIRSRSAVVLGKIMPPAPEAVAALAGLLRDDSSAVRWSAAEALGFLGPEAAAAVPHLMTFAKAEGEDAASIALAALGRIGKPASPAIPLIRELRAKGSKGLRRVADEALKEIGAP